MSKHLVKECKIIVASTANQAEQITSKTKINLKCQSHYQIKFQKLTSLLKNLNNHLVQVMFKTHF